jgi:hypothetical protein
MIGMDGDEGEILPPVLFLFNALKLKRENLIFSYLCISSSLVYDSFMHIDKMNLF